MTARAGKQVKAATGNTPRSGEPGAEIPILRDERLDADVNEILAIISDAQRAVDRQLKSLARKVKLPPRGIFTLTLIHAGLDRPSLLVDYFNALPSTMTLEVDRLVEAGLVTRKPDSQDRRIIRLALTRKGNKFREDVMDTVNAMFLPKMSAIPKAEFQACLKTLRKFVY
jgi:DNA-binding MarR family transcriptional regulator